LAEDVTWYGLNGSLAVSANATFHRQLITSLGTEAEIRSRAVVTLASVAADAFGTKGKTKRSRAMMEIVRSLKGKIEGYDEQVATIAEYLEHMPLDNYKPEFRWLRDAILERFYDRPIAPPIPSIASPQP
jgi:hypothetical protein